MNLSFLLPKTRRDFAAAGRRLARLEKRGAGSLERGGEEDLTTKDTNRHETGKIIDGKIIGITEGEAGPCLVKPSGAAFSNPSPSELARDSENSSLTRSASGPASPATSYLLPPACGVRRLLHQAATAPEVPTPATSYPLPPACGVRRLLHQAATAPEVPLLDAGLVDTRCAAV